MSAPLVKPEDVQAIFPTLDSRITPTPFIKAAHVLVQRVLVDTAEITDAETLFEIERWLAAHFCAVADPMHSSESGTGISASRALPSMGEGLDSTFYGKQVLAFDYTGLINDSMMRKQSIQFFCVGTGGSDNGNIAT